MIINPNVLREKLSATLKEVELQITATTEEARRLGFDPYRLRDSHGRWPMIDLLAAKANALHALALLNKEK